VTEFFELRKKSEKSLVILKLIFSLSAYKDEVNMLIVSYCATHKEDLSWRYKFAKANIQQAAKDHFYDALPITEI